MIGQAGRESPYHQGAGRSKKHHVFKCSVLALIMIGTQLIFNIGLFVLLMSHQGGGEQMPPLMERFRVRRRGHSSQAAASSAIASSTSANADRQLEVGTEITNSDSDSIRGYDIVTVVHHDDLDTFVTWGLQSLEDKLLDFDGLIYAVGTVQAEQKLQSLKAEREGNTTAWKRLRPISERIYPFALEDIQNTVSVKKSWVYQQVLKLYVYRTLTKQDIPLRRHFLVIDADTVLLRPIRMQDTNGRWFMNIASHNSGAFSTDCDAGNFIVLELFGPGIPKAFPAYGDEKFTAIAHHMLFDGKYLDDMLNYLEEKYGRPATDVLPSRKSYLSEYELYAAWMMTHHKESIALRPLPYVNWGRADEVTLDMAKQYGSTYLSNHDEWGPANLCCVNAAWPNSSIAQLEAIHTPECACCSPPCQHTRIDCQVLGIDGCGNVDSVEDESTWSLMTCRKSTATASSNFSPSLKSRMKRLRKSKAP